MNSDLIGPGIMAAGAVLAALINVLGVLVGEKRSGQQGSRKFLKSNPFILLTLVLLAAVIWLAIPPTSSLYPRKDGLIADFSTGLGGPPRNALRETFGIILDSEGNGKSKCWYNLLWEQRVNGGKKGFMRLYYELVPRGIPDAEAYVGVFTDFSYPPPKTFDISKYSGLSFKMRMNRPVPEGVQVVVALASSNIPPSPGTYDFPEYRIPSYYLNGSWQDIKVTWSSFGAPNFSCRKDEIILDTTKVFRLSFAIKARVEQPIQGYLDIDDIRFDIRPH